MAEDLLNTVRVRKNVNAQKSLAERGGALDLKVSLYKLIETPNIRIVKITDSKNSPIVGKDPIQYDTNGRYGVFTDDDFIREYLSSISKLEPPNVSEIEDPITKKLVPVYEIIQNPWQENSPIIRKFGSDPYFLNNGVKVEILWYRIRNGVYSEEGGTEWSDTDNKSLLSSEKKDVTRTINDFDIRITRFDIHKAVKLTTPDNSVYGIRYLPETERKLRKSGGKHEETEIVAYNSVKKLSEWDGKSPGNEWFLRDVTDYQMLEYVSKLYAFQLERNKIITNENDYLINLCTPDYDSCRLIEFKDPIFSPPDNKDLNKETKPVKTTDGSETNSSGTKIKMNLLLPDGFISVANKDMPSFRIFLGKVPDKEINPYRPEPELADEEMLDEEFIEIGLLAESESDEQDKEFDPVKSDNDSKVLEEVENKTPTPPQQQTTTPSSNQQTQSVVTVDNKPIVQGKWELTPIPGEFVTNSGKKIKCTIIDGKVVNLSFAAAYLDMQAAAKKDGISVSISSGFRSPYDSIKVTAPFGYQDGKRVSNAKASSDSQKSLYDSYLAGKGNLAAKPGESNHGNGIALDLNPGGTSKGRYINVNEKIYEWLVKNSWKFGFVRAVATEEWHFEYNPSAAKNGPYGVLPAKDTGVVKTKFYNKKKDGSYWGLDEIKIA